MCDNMMFRRYKNRGTKLFLMLSIVAWVILIMSHFEQKEDDICLYMPPGRLNVSGCGWSFQCRVDCPDWPNVPTTTDLAATRSYIRTQYVPVCNVSSVTVHVTRLKVTTLPALPFNSTCLQRLISAHCDDGQIVPNLVHYMWFGKREMGFFHFLSFWSVYKIVKPCFIFVHADYLPHGYYWQLLLTLVPNLIHVSRSQPMYIFGVKIRRVEHSADFARMEALQAFGGIYVDTDTIMLRHLDPLRRYNFTMSRELKDNLSNGLMLSVKNATFLRYWFEGYRKFDPTLWAEFSVMVPARIAEIHKDDIHVEDYTFVRPNYRLAHKWIFTRNFIWQDNYALHLYARYYNSVHNFTGIRTLNTTVGSVARFALFGNKELCNS